MTSNRSLADALTETLVTHEYNDVTGTVTVNVADAMMAIANSINRLAVVTERIAACHEGTAAEALAATRRLEVLLNNQGGHA